MTRPDYHTLMHTALNFLLSEVAAEDKTPVEFGANLMLAHEYWVAGVPTADLIRMVSALHELGVTRIDMNLGSFPWAFTPDIPTIVKYDAVIAKIRALGMRLAFNPQYSATYWPMANLAAWQTACLAFYEFVANRYEPDIFVVVHEPTTMATRLGGVITVQNWLDFAEATAAVVASASPSTQIGAGGLAADQLHFEAFAGSASIDVLTLDIYSLADMPTFTEMVETANTAVKPVYIAETWRTPFATTTSGTAEEAAVEGVGDEDFVALDIKWLTALTQWARTLGLTEITAVWPQPFFRYMTIGEGSATDPTYTAAVLQALLRHQRTPAFKAYKDLIAENIED